MGYEIIVGYLIAVLGTVGCLVTVLGAVLGAICYKDTVRKIVGCVFIMSFKSRLQC